MTTGLIVNGVVIGLLSAIVIANLVMRKVARHHLLYNLPTIFTMYLITLTLMDVVFVIATILWTTVSGDALAEDLMLSYPRWFSLALVSIMAPSHGLQFVIDVCVALILAAVVPVTGIVANLITDVDDYVDDAIIVAKTLLTLLFYYFICKRGPSAAFMMTVGLFLLVILVADIVSALAEDALQIMWVFAPVVYAAFYTSETYAVRHTYAHTKSYVDFSVVHRLQCKGLIGYRPVEFVPTDAGTASMEAASLQNTEYANSKLIACHGFTVDLPRYEIVMEAGLWPLSHLRTMLVRIPRPPIISLVYLADCARAVQAIHTLSAHTQRALDLSLDDFVVCNDGVKLKRVRTPKAEVSPAYMAPESFAVRTSQRSDAPVEHAMDVYSLGVVFWEILHPAKTFAIAWKQEQAHVVFDDYPNTLQTLVTQMLSRKPDARPTAHDIVMTIDQLIYKHFAELADDLDIDTPFTGHDLQSTLLREHAAIHVVEAARICQYMLTSMILKIVHAELASPASVNFTQDDLEFSLDNIYTITAHGLETPHADYQESPATPPPVHKSVEL